MDVLLLCGYFEKEFQEEIGQKTKTWVENAANTFQERLISGFRNQDLKLHILSAPFIGPWPTVYRDILFTGFDGEELRADKSVKYVRFNNIWGYRNLSRTAALKREVDSFLKSAADSETAIIVYSPHTPFLEAAVYAKRKKPNIHIHMVVPDLPQYMNLSKAKHPIYDFFKKIDIRKFYRLNRHVDSYTLLTKHMAEMLDVGDRPYLVVEAIVDEVPQRLGNGHPRGKTVAYAGKLTEGFGVKRLVEAFRMIEDPQARLELCGGGELRAYVEEMCRMDSRIHYHGQVPAETAQQILQNADVLVNPRINDDVYTKYSFPSKNVEYLLTGNRVVAYMLDGMPEIYAKLLICPPDNTIVCLKEVIDDLLNTNSHFEERNTIYMQKYLSETLEKKKVANMIVLLIRHLL